MRILIIQENGRHKENWNFRECYSLQRAFLKLDQDCDVWGLGHANYTTVPDFDCYDVIINLENYDEAGWVPDLSQATARKFLWAIDGHVRGMDTYLQEFHRGKYEKILQATVQLVDENSIWFPNAFDDSLIKPLDIQKTQDVGFCGNILNRGDLIDFLKEKFNVKTDIFVIGNAMVEAINSYKIHFNCNIGIDINYRNFETIGCGTALVTNFNPAYKELGFVDKENCVLYNTVGTLMSSVDYLLQNPEEVERLAQNGLALSKKHTYLERAKQFLEELK